MAGKRWGEAIVKVASETAFLLCFSCPCTWRIGDVLYEPLECLDVNAIMLCEAQHY